MSCFFVTAEVKYSSRKIAFKTARDGEKKHDNQQQPPLTEGGLPVAQPAYLCKTRNDHRNSSILGTWGPYTCFVSPVLGIEFLPIVCSRRSESCFCRVSFYSLPLQLSERLEQAGAPTATTVFYKISFRRRKNLPRIIYSLRKN